ncbi:hypothetical protein Marme_1825 [Marinomonas mediterranea MMB-1]|jgi:hypothetical protein|uniref:Uncharacterized protein n=1 Tax=Marinomonas mediterranea (strain ATCC 700492 / JCM 21426 / NBRC 103028 / MMB-1) TaxID=717774 RepID=F2K1F0_MARM1|nr:hypothetical protein Marme_1825 [Marinomonas mediterranea MMB-1]
MKRKIHICQSPSSFNFEDSEILSPNKKLKKKKSVYELCQYQVNYTESDFNLVKILRNRFQ